MKRLSKYLNSKSQWKCPDLTIDTKLDKVLEYFDFHHFKLVPDNFEKWSDRVMFLTKVAKDNNCDIIYFNKKHKYINLFRAGQFSWSLPVYHMTFDISNKIQDIDILNPKLDHNPAYAEINNQFIESQVTPETFKIFYRSLKETFDL